MADAQTTSSNSADRTPPPPPCHLSAAFRAAGAGSARLFIYRAADRELDSWWAVTGA